MLCVLPVQNAKSILLTLHFHSDVTENIYLGEILTILENCSQISYLTVFCNCLDIEVALNIYV